MKIAFRTHLKIRDQNELLNQIAGTYKDFYRAAMEYIDNAIDAASILKEKGKELSAAIHMNVDPISRKVTFIDNCGGMSPEELGDLLSEVGRSKKKAVPWANGQFGFGVHAFRAFAKEAVFISKKSYFDEAKIVIDRSFDEDVAVPCEITNGTYLKNPGTMVTISKFDPQVFKKATFNKALISEIEHHFDDVLRSGLITIDITDNSTGFRYQCRPFDYDAAPGTALKKDYPVTVDGKTKMISVDLKVLERVQENRLPILTNKMRRIQSIADLKSYKNYAREKGRDISVWSNPFIVGSIEINDICSPNLTRDDLRDSQDRDYLYAKIFEVQIELENLIDAIMNKKTQESFHKLSNIMSDCLSRIMKRFRLQFEQLVPSPLPGDLDRRLIEEEGDMPFGGEGPGGGGIGPNDRGSGGQISEAGRSGPGTGDTGGGVNEKNKSSSDGPSKGQLTQSSGPRIEFQNHAGADRVINLGNSLIINTLHPDFIKRNASKSGRVKLDTRLINYVSMVIAPDCIQRLFEKKGKVPTPLEVGSNVIDLSLRLEQELVATVLNEEIGGSNQNE